MRFQLSQSVRETLWVGLVAVLAHAASLPGEILGFDDTTYILQNPIVRGPLEEALLLAFAEPYFGSYHPLHVLSYRIDHCLFGLAPWGYHLLNVLGFAAACGLLGAFLRRAFPGQRWAFWAALLFAAHPVHVESVAWLSSRKDVLALLFGALYAYCHVRAVAAPTRRRALTFVAAGLLSFAAALLSKSIVAPLPLVLLAHDLLLARRRPGVALLVVGPALILAAAQLMQAWEGQVALGWILPLPGGSYVGAALTTTTVLARYLGMLVAPVGLSAIYEVDAPGVGDASFVLSAALLAGIAAVLVVSLRRGARVPLWSALCFLLMLAPVTPFTPLSHLMADRYLLFPSLGFCVLVGWSAAAAGARWPGLRRFGRLWLLLVLATGVSLCAARSLDWHDDLRLWSDTVQKAPGDTTSLVNFASALANRGQLREAAIAYGKVLVVQPGYPRARQNLAWLAADLRRRGDTVAAALAERLLFEGASALGPAPGR